jgi:Glycine zipper
MPTGAATKTVPTPSATSTVETFLAGPPADPKLRQIGEHILAEVVASAVKVLANGANPKAFPISGTDPLEKSLAARFAAKPAPRRTAAAQRAVAIATKPNEQTSIKNLRLVNFTSAASAAKQLASHQPAISMSVGELARAAALSPLPSRFDHIGLDDDDEEPKTAPPGGQGQAHPHLTLDPAVVRNISKALGTKKASTPKLHLVPYEGCEVRLIKLACIETTSGAGEDEISLAGTTVSGNGTTRKIDPFMVSDSFDSGQTHEFGLVVDFHANPPIQHNGPTIFTRFPYKADNTVTANGKKYKVGWPRSYWVTFLLCEVDNGGFPAFVDDIYHQVKAKVITAVATAVGAAVGGVVGTSIPGLGTAIGAAVGALVGWIIGEFWGWLKGLWEDDEFSPITIGATRKSPFSRYKNESSFDSPNKVVWWKELGGEYRLKFDWKVYGGLAPAH